MLLQEAGAETEEEGLSLKALSWLKLGHNMMLLSFTGKIIYIAFTLLSRSSTEGIKELNAGGKHNGNFVPIPEFLMLQL